jgi:hypothetical protein
VTDITELWEKVADATQTAKAIAFDTCHKIYVLMDDEQVELMIGYGYDCLITSQEASPEEFLSTLREWYDDSCGLRFINAVETNHRDPNEGFTNLIPQFAEEEFEDD